MAVVAAIAALLLILLFFTGFLSGLGPSNALLSAEFQPATIKSGQSSVLVIKIENQKNEAYQPKVRIRTETRQDGDYLSLGLTEWALYPMENKGEVQIKKINVTASSPASESRFNVVVELKEGNTTAIIKKVPLIVQREG